MFTHFDYSNIFQIGLVQLSTTKPAKFSVGPPCRFPWGHRSRTLTKAQAQQLLEDFPGFPQGAFGAKKAPKQQKKP